MPYKSLDHAIWHALCIGPISELKNRAPRVLEAYINSKIDAAIEKRPYLRAVFEELRRDLNLRAKPG